MNDPVAGELRAIRERLDLIWANHEREHVQHEQAHSREHAFSQQAIDTAATLSKENKADANEWRASMTDREARFATKDDVKAILGTLGDLKTSETRRLETERLGLLNVAAEKQSEGDRQRRSQWVVGVIVGVIATGSSILVNVLLRS